MRMYDDMKDEPWWQLRPNATGKLQARPLVKLVTALQIRPYGDGRDRIDDCHDLSKTTVHNTVTRFHPSPDIKSHCNSAKYDYRAEARRVRVAVSPLPWRL